ncbi:MAG: chromosomal replication initiator protein DnaA [Methylobacteriaceae bacterium]|nr:chromosomal replication initiator protein DnaA [Methylobacteriaceae bacterium]
MPHSQQRKIAANQRPESGVDERDEMLTAIWTRVCARLRSELGDAVYRAWFARLELDGVAGGVGQLSVPTRFLKSWIQSHYMDRLLAALSAEAPHIVSIVLEVRTGMRAPRLRPATNAPARPSAAPRDEETQVRAETPRHSALRPAAADGEVGEGFSGSALDRRFTFANFAVGKSNQLAHAAAERIARGDGQTALYNPLYLHAAVGLGKTHLLQAVAHAASEASRRVIYLTAERFMYGFVAALKAQTAIAFKETLRAIDVLVIDDIQFLQGKTIQQEFCHTLNALIDARRQIVIAADRAPGDLEMLDERARSRLLGGLAVEIEALDLDLRRRILAARIAAAQQLHPGFQPADQVVDYVASTVQSNGRDLEGAVNRLLIHTDFGAKPLKLELAEEAIRDLVRTREPKRVKIEDIQKLVGNYYNVSRADIVSSRRTANVVRPRQIAMYLSKILTPRSLPEIGRRFGGRDHTTVLHAVRKIETLSKSDRTLGEDLELLKRMLLE